MDLEHAIHRDVTNVVPWIIRRAIQVGALEFSRRERGPSGRAMAGMALIALVAFSLASASCGGMAPDHRPASTSPLAPSR